jgi:hypothetical protein
MWPPARPDIGDLDIGETDVNDRVVLARRTPHAMVDMQWTGEEPPGLSDTRLAVLVGATWEADELVSYNLPLLRRTLEQYGNQYLEDSD